MSDPRDTVYDAEPHTQAKHQILREYLKRWLPILSRQSQIIGRTGGRLLYVDGFAGAGEYTDKIPGSPLVAIETALSHSRDFPVPVRIKLIELRPDRVQHLRKLVAARRPEIEKSNRVILDDPIEGDCREVINGIIDACEQEGRRLGPALFFLDQFGYSSFSMSLIGRILKHDVCEVFSYLNWNLLHPFMSDPAKRAGITSAFGGEEWMPVIELSGSQKEDRFRDTYLDALHSRAGAKYTYPFAMRDRSNRLIYWLFFCTNSLDGLKQMKRAMRRVDPSGGFQFSDRFASQLGPLFTYGDDDLARDLSKELDGQTMTVGEVEEFVLVNTPASKYRRALGNLERTKRLKPVDPPAGRPRHTFKDKGMKVRFIRPAKLDGPTLFSL